jgi:hypothetical protein
MMPIPNNTSIGGKETKPGNHQDALELLVQCVITPVPHPPE